MTRMLCASFARFGFLWFSWGFLTIKFILEKRSVHRLGHLWMVSKLSLGRLVHKMEIMIVLLRNEFKMHSCIQSS